MKKKHEDQAKLWPCLLPGIANVINNTWHATIDDIPFRIYRGRSPLNISHTIVPDDDEFTLMGEASESSDETFDEDDLQIAESDTTDEEGTTELQEINVSEFTMSSLYQSCASSSLSSSLMRSTSLEPDISKTTAQHCVDGPEEEEGEHEFSIINFNASLYTMTSRLTAHQMRALEATETMIHRNIERCFKGFPERQF